MTEMKKYKVFFDDAKEEKWINDMSAKGWHLTNYNYRFYTFEKGEPDEYTYRCDLLDNFGFGKAAKEYIEFVESTGAEKVFKRLHWVYFRQHRDLGPFELYSDATSKLSYINRMLTLYGTVIFLNVISAFANGGLSFTDSGLRMNSFLSGVNSGITAVLLIPTVGLWLRRRKLKKKLTLFEV